jgi:hypothetical protein
MIAAFGAAVILPAASGTGSAYAQTKKKDAKQKKPASKTPGSKTPGKM